MAITFREITGLGTPVSIAGLQSGRLFAMWYREGSWMYADAETFESPFSEPQTLSSVFQADGATAPDLAFLKAVAVRPWEDVVYFAFRFIYTGQARGEGASSYMIAGKAEYSAGWTFTFSDSGAQMGDLLNRRSGEFNNQLLPDLRFDGDYIHVLTAEPNGFSVTDQQDWTLSSFAKTDMTSVANITQTEDTSVHGRITSLSMGNKGSKLAVTVSFADGTVKSYPEIEATAGAYTTFPGTGTELSGSALESIERPITATAWEASTDDVHVYALGDQECIHWKYDASGPSWGSPDTVTTGETMESIEAERSASDTILCQMAGFTGPKLRVDDDACLASNLVALPPGASLPFRSLVRTGAFSNDGEFLHSNIVVINDLEQGRVYLADWRSTPLTPIDLTPDDGSEQNTATPTLKARYRMQEELTGSLVFEIDGDPAFGSIDQTLTASSLADQQIGQVTAAALAEGTWYWRVRGHESTRGYGVYSAVQSFTVGATLTGINPEDGIAITAADDPHSVSSVALFAAVHVYSGTARAEFQVDRVETFDSGSLVSANGTYVSDGGQSNASANLADGVWFVRARAKTLAGSSGAWYPTQGFRIGHSGDVGNATPTVNTGPRRRMTQLPKVSRRGADLVNRVYVKVRGSAIEVVRETDPAPAEDRRREQVVWLEAGDESTCAAVARDYLEANGTTRTTVDDIQVPLTPDLALDRRVRLYNVPGLANAAYKVQRISHDLTTFTTTITAGDYSPSLEAAIARLADRLERTRSEDRASG